MTDFIFNIAKGHPAEWFRNVDLASAYPNSCLVGILLAATSIELPAVLATKLTLTDLVAGATNEATNSGYYRKKWTGADIAMPNPDNANNRIDLDIPVDPQWGTGATGVSNDGTGQIGAFVVCYLSDASTGTIGAAGLSGTTAANNMWPMSYHDYPVFPSGAPLVVQLNPAGFIRCQGPGGGL